MYTKFYRNPIYYLILSILILTSCNDSIEENKQISKFDTKNKNNIQEIITSFDHTIKKSLNYNYTKHELSQIFSEKVESLGVEPIIIDKTIDSLNLSSEYWIVANKISNIETYNNSNEYKNHLQNLKINLSNYNLTSRELQVSKLNIDFMLAFVTYLENLDKSKSKNLSKSDCDGWWDCWGSCAAGTLGSAITGAVGGCAGIGALGYSIGSAFSPVGAIIGGASGCRVGGILGFIGGALSGSAESCD